MNKLLKFGIFGFPGVIHELSKKDTPTYESVTESESTRIREIIIEARRQNLSEITAEVSKDFADKISLGGMVPIEGINANVEAKSGSTKNGKVALSLKLNPDDTYLQIEKLASLYEQGILTDSEFITAKQRLIDKL